MASRHITERLHQAFQGVANELIVVNDRNDRLFAQTALRHCGKCAQSRGWNQPPVLRLYPVLETLEGQLLMTKPWFMRVPQQSGYSPASIVGKLMS
jgi:hypothetical protein